MLANLRRVQSGSRDGYRIGPISVHGEQFLSMMIYGNILKNRWFHANILVIYQNIIVKQIQNFHRSVICPLFPGSAEPSRFGAPQKKKWHAPLVIWVLTLRTLPLAIAQDVMADIMRSAKSGSDWTHSDLDSYHITIHQVDHLLFFGLQVSCGSSAFVVGKT